MSDKTKYYVQFNEIFPDCELDEDRDSVGNPDKYCIELTKEEYNDYLDVGQRHYDWNYRILVAIGYYPKDRIT